MCFYICMIQILKLTNINEIIQRYKYIQYIIQLLLVCRASNTMPPLILMHRTTCFPSYLISVLSSDLQSLMFISSHHRVQRLLPILWWCGQVRRPSAGLPRDVTWPCPSPAECYDVWRVLVVMCVPSRASNETSIHEYTYSARPAFSLLKVPTSGFTISKTLLKHYTNVHSRKD